MQKKIKDKRDIYIYYMDYEVKGLHFDCKSKVIGSIPT